MAVAQDAKNSLARRWTEPLPKLADHAGSWGHSRGATRSVSTFHHPAVPGEGVREAAGPRTISGAAWQREVDAGRACGRVDACGVRRRDGVPRLFDEPGRGLAEPDAGRVDR